MAKRRTAGGKSNADAARDSPPAPARAVVADSAAAQESDQAERSMGRAVAIGLPAVTLVAAVAVGMASSVGPALLVMAGGALLGTIAFFWASVRTLSGDAPLAEDLESIAARSHSVGRMAERKQSILRGLKDLEHEHSIGKIDDADYAEVSAAYREEAKAVMREMDGEIAPLRERAERIVEVHLRKKGLLPTGSTAPVVVPEPEPEEEADAEADADASTAFQAPVSPGEAPVSRLTCKLCETSNESDATFCKKCGASLQGDADDAAREGTNAPA